MLEIVGLEKRFGGRTVLAGLGLSVDALADEVRGYHVGQSGSVWLVRADPMEGAFFHLSAVGS